MVQAAYGAVSSWHWKFRLPAGVTLSVPAKRNVALVSVVVAGGCALIVVSGSTVSAGVWIDQA